MTIVKASSTDLGHSHSHEITRARLSRAAYERREETRARRSRPVTRGAAARARHGQPQRGAR
jgi:hypothetical protein